MYVDQYQLLNTIRLFIVLTYKQLYMFYRELHLWIDRII